MKSNSKSASTPIVSVVIATHNMAEHVCEAVTSVLRQTFTDLEVILVDDGSTDNTQERLRQFESEPRFRRLVTPKQGQPRAKNAGIDEARGKFVAFCDADDYWLPRKLELQMPVFSTSERIGVVYSPATALHVDGRQHLLQGPKCLCGDVLEEMFVRNVVPFGTAVVRRVCIDDVGVFDESIPMGIDWDWWLRISTRWHFHCIPESTYMYRIWGGQMSKNWRGRYDCALAIMDKFLAANPDRLPRGIVATAYADTYTNLAGHLLKHAGPAACLDTLRKALSAKPHHLPAWGLLLGLPYYWLVSPYHG